MSRSRSQGEAGPWSEDPWDADPWADGGWPGGSPPGEHYGDPERSRDRWPRRRRRGGWVAAFTIPIALILAASAGAIFAVLMHRGPAPQVMMNDQDVYDKIAPSVVDITASLSYDAETAEGTGFVIDARNGLVLTNNHVIADSTSVTATLPASGRSYLARVIGDNANDDVALLQLQGASGLVAAPLGDSGATPLGAPIVGIGNQGGEGGAPVIAPGYVSSLGRTIRAVDQASGSTETLRNMLQVTAQIQPGDSGGPLANAAGEVIGMDTAATAPGSGTGAAGFAIPITAAVSDANAITAGRAAPGVTIGVPGFLGVVVADTTPANPPSPDFAASITGSSESISASDCLNMTAEAAIPRGMERTRDGAVVEGVLCGTAAARTGLGAGDVIVSIGGTPVSSGNALSAIMGATRPGRWVTVKWLTATGQRRSARLLLGDAPAR